MGGITGGIEGGKSGGGGEGCLGRLRAESFLRERVRANPWMRIPRLVEMTEERREDSNRMV